MPHRYFPLLTVLFPMALMAQTTFAPPGARWTYQTTSNMSWPPTLGHYPMMVVGDTLLAGRTCSIVHMPSSFFYPFDLNSGSDKDVFIATSADSILLYTPEDERFHPLMVFNAVPGNSWRIPITAMAPSNELEHDTLIYEVYAVDTLWHANTPLRRVAHISSNTDHVVYTVGSGTFIERLGDMDFIFPWQPKFAMDYEGIHDLLCYSDPSFRWPDPDEACALWMGQTALPVLEFSVSPTVCAAGSPITIRTTRGVQLGPLQVMDGTGRLVEQQGRTTDHALVVPQRPGLYLLRLSDEHGRSATRRVVVQ